MKKLLLSALLLLAGLFAFGQKTLPELEAGWKKYGLYQPSLAPLPLEFGAYQVDAFKLGGLALVAVGGLANGMLQGFEFDGRRSFERKFGASPTGYWGSLSWTKRYRHGRPELGLSSPLYKVLPVADFYHTAQFVHHHSLVTGGVFIGIGAVHSNKKLQHYAIDLLFSAIVNSAAQAAGLAFIRQ